MICDVIMGLPLVGVVVVTMVMVGVAEVVSIGTGMRRVLVLESGGSGDDSGLDWWPKILSLSSSSKEVFCDDDLGVVSFAPSSPPSWPVEAFLLRASIRRSMAVNNC